MQRHVERAPAGDRDEGAYERLQGVVGAAPCSSCPSSLPSPSFDPGRLLLNRRIILTGAGSGIGLATALLFAAHGARLVLADLDSEKLTAAIDFIRNSGARRCVALAGDVTDDCYVAKLIDLAVNELGGIDDLVMVAGFTWDGVVHKMRDEQWSAMLDVHVTGPFRMLRRAAPYMRDAAKAELARDGIARPRSVLTVSSVSGMYGNAGQTNYAAAKAGVIGLTKALSKEWGAFNIRANTVVFGHIRTRLTGDKQLGATINYRGTTVPLGIPVSGNDNDILSRNIDLQRAGTAEEAAGALLLLTSPYASYISGQAIEVSGGWT